MEMNIKETINLREDLRYMEIEINTNKEYMRRQRHKTRNLNEDVEGTKLGNRELFRDLSKSMLVDTTLKKSGYNDY